MRQSFSAAVLLVVALWPHRATACSCASPGPPCQQYFQVDAVFVGTVRSISTVEETTDSTYRRRSVAFAVERAFRGVQGTALDVATGMGGGDCGYDFKVGERYLVYAYRNARSELSASICSRTRPAAKAEEDLRYFETLPASGTGARVYGVITHWESDLATGDGRKHGPVPFVHVQLRGKLAALDSESDEQGRYAMAGIPPGTYELQAIPPAVFSSRYLQRTIELRDARACSESDFSVHYDGRISGVVLDADGQAAAGVGVEAIAVERAASTRYVPARSTRTDVGGSFEFSEVPPGRYVVGVSLQHTDPAVVYPRTYHPGTAIVSDATVVTVGEGNRQQLEPLRLPPPRQSRELMGTIVWPDGRPAPGAFISLWDGASTWRQVGSGIQTDADGRFRFLVHDGLSYVARAHYNMPDDPNHRQAHAIVGPFLVSAQLSPLTVVLVTPPD